MPLADFFLIDTISDVLSKRIDLRVLMVLKIFTRDRIHYYQTIIKQYVESRSSLTSSQK